MASQTIRKTIANWAKKKPQAMAICCPDNQCQYDYLTLDKTLQKYHSFFNYFNIKPKSKTEKGDIFVAAFPNSKALLELVLGAYYNHRTGLPVVPLVYINKAISSGLVFLAKSTFCFSSCLCSKESSG